MVERCREKAAREGFSPDLSVQPMHGLDTRRRYRTIVVCVAFGLGSTREQDTVALSRMHDLLEPGGTLLLDVEVPYADARLWRRWPRDSRGELPEPPKPIGERRLASDGAEYALRSRDPGSRPAVATRHVRDPCRALARRRERGRGRPRLDVNVYFPGELRAMLERAGFADNRAGAP
jgi:hypothetical protein